MAAGRAGAPGFPARLFYCPTVYWAALRDLSPRAHHFRITVASSRALLGPWKRCGVTLLGSGSPPRPLGPRHGSFPDRARLFWCKGAANCHRLAIDDLQQRARGAMRHPAFLLPIAQCREIEREGLRELLLRQAEFGTDRLDIGR